MIRITIGTATPITIEVDEMEAAPRIVTSAPTVEPITAPVAVAVVEAVPDNGSDPVQEKLLQQTLLTGRSALATMMEEWIVGFGCPLDEKGKATVEQPDRLKLLQRSMGTNGRAIMAYIDNQGGLRKAIRSVVPDAMLPDVDYQTYTTELAGNIVQLASITVPPLADTMDYTHADSQG
jgi:hypothetical protein